MIPGGDNTARLWELPGGTQTRPPVVQTGWVSALALSRDGRRLFVRSGDAYVNVHTVNFKGGEIRGQIHFGDD